MELSALSAVSHVAKHPTQGLALTLLDMLLQDALADNNAWEYCAFDGSLPHLSFCARSARSCCVWIPSLRGDANSSVDGEAQEHEVLDFLEHAAQLAQPQSYSRFR